MAKLLEKQLQDEKNREVKLSVRMIRINGKGTRISL